MSFEISSAIVDAPDASSARSQSVYGPAWRFIPGPAGTLVAAQCTPSPERHARCIERRGDGDAECACDISPGSAISERPADEGVEALPISFRRDPGTGVKVKLLIVDGEAPLVGAFAPILEQAGDLATPVLSAAQALSRLREER